MKRKDIGISNLFHDGSTAIVNALISPRMYIPHPEPGMLSTDGCCRTFDQGVNGYVRAEGAGALYLKTLDQAQARADGDRVAEIIQ